MAESKGVKYLEGEEEVVGVTRTIYWGQFLGNGCNCIVKFIFDTLKLLFTKHFTMLPHFIQNCIRPFKICLVVYVLYKLKRTAFINIAD